MISRTTENVANKDELTDAFKLLTDGGDKPYITASELYAAMPPDQVTIQPPSYPYCSNKSRPSRTPHETECWSPQTLQRVRAVERTLANSPRISLNATRTCILSLSIVSEFRLWQVQQSKSPWGLADFSELFVDSKEYKSLPVRGKYHKILYTKILQWHTKTLKLILYF